MKNLIDIPEGCDQIKVVGSMEELFAAKFSRKVNAIVFPRRLKGDFDAAAQVLRESLYAPGLTLLSPEMVEKIFLPQKDRAIKAAGQQIYDDVRWARRAGFGVSLKSLRTGDVSGDLHHDTSIRSSRKGRLLCCYNVAATEWVSNADAEKTYNRNGYLLKPHGVMHAFGIGDIWRHATDRSGLFVKPFIHRTPHVIAKVPRLVLIS